MRGAHLTNYTASYKCEMTFHKTKTTPSHWKMLTKLALNIRLLIKDLRF